MLIRIKEIPLESINRRYKLLSVIVEPENAPCEAKIPLVELLELRV